MSDRYEKDVGSKFDTPKAPTRFQFLSITDLRAKPHIPWRIQKVIPGRGLIVLWGAPGSGKSFVLLDMLTAIGRCVPWHGRRTGKQRGAVALILLEGSPLDRQEAHMERNGYEADDIENVRVLTSPINLIAGDDIGPLLESLEALRERFGSVSAVAIDTLNRAMPGGNENAPQDMGRVIAAAKAIEDRFQCAVILVHHSGKNEDLGARGHNSLNGAVDAELHVRRSGNVREVFVSKMRDGEDQFSALMFELVPVDLGPLTDIDPEAEEGERRISRAVVPVDSPPTVSRRRPSGKNQKLLYQALERAVSLYGKHPPGKSPSHPVKAVTEDQLRAEAAKDEFRHIDPKHRSTRINDALSGLKADRYVDWFSDHLWLRVPTPETPVSKDTEGVSGVGIAPKGTVSGVSGNSGVRA